MRNITPKKMVTTVMIACIAIVLLVSCSQGVPVEDARDMQQEIVSVSNRVSQIEASLVALKSEELETHSAEFQMVIDELLDELSTIKTRMAELEAKLDFPEPNQTDPAMDAGNPGAMAPAPGF